jgi:hypothetical protein
MDDVLSDLLVTDRGEKRGDLRGLIGGTANPADAKCQCNLGSSCATAMEGLLNRGFYKYNRGRMFYLAKSPCSIL